MVFGEVLYSCRRSDQVVENQDRDGAFLTADSNTSKLQVRFIHEDGMRRPEKPLHAPKSHWDHL
jgi:hypothetical protein